MTTYISILRGINVSGKNLIKMNLLQDMYKDSGFRNVKTYIQSGNVVFESEETFKGEIERILTNGIWKKFAVNVPVILREKSELKVILEQNPFLHQSKYSIDNLYITLLSKIPEKKFLEVLNNRSYLPDEYAIINKTIYLFCPNGYGKTKLSNNFFENKLKVIATTRNLKTLTELVRISESD